MERDQLTRKIIGCAIEVHRSLGPGLLESVYEECMAREMTQAGISYKRQFPLPVIYKGSKLDCDYRVDFLVADSIIVELKSVEALEGIHKAQTLTYMKLAGIKTGILINFNVEILKQGIRRLTLKI